MFTVVNFLEEDTVAFVPTSWLIGRTLCAWPATQQCHADKLRETCSPPCTDWEKHACRILGTADTLIEARNKTKRAEYTSNIESDYDQPRHKLSPNRLINKQSTPAKKRKVSDGRMSSHADSLPQSKFKINKIYWNSKSLFLSL